LVDQIFLGDITPSSLLLSYLRYAVTTKLVEPLDFFDAVLNRASLKPDPSKAAQFGAYLELFATFAKQSFVDVIAANHSHGCRLVLEIAILLLKGIEDTVNKIQEWFVAQTPDQPKPLELSSQTQSNALLCIKLLTSMFSKKISLLLVLVGKEEHPGMYLY
jgi:hypothetical protein